MAAESQNWATREDVRGMGQDIKEQIATWKKEQRERSDEKHREGIERIDALTEEVRETIGKVILLEERHRSLFEEFQAIRKRWHDFRDSIQSKLTGPPGPQGIQGIQGLSGENRLISMRDVYLFTGGLGMFYAIAKLFKWLP